MKAAHEMSQSERREYLESCLENAEFMLKLERDISTIPGWSIERKSAANSVIPGWEKRILELKTTLKGY